MNTVRSANRYGAAPLAGGAVFMGPGQPLRGFPADKRRLIQRP
jgi:hypothetical protein